MPETMAKALSTASSPGRPIARWQNPLAAFNCSIPGLPWRDDGGSILPRWPPICRRSPFHRGRTLKAWENIHISQSFKAFYHNLRMMGIRMEMERGCGRVRLPRKKEASPQPPPIPGCSIRRRGNAPPRGRICVHESTRDLWDRLFAEGYRADVCINTDNGGIIRAHSSVLGMASPVLKSMLKQSKRSGHIQSLSICGVPHQAVRIFIRFLYSSSYEKEEMNEYALHLVVLSHVFLIPSLKQECVRHLENDFLATDNVIDIFQLARLCDIPRLSLICRRMILSNFKAVSASEGWKVMRQSNPKLEKELTEAVVDANSKRERARTMQERKIYLHLHEAMEALVHICRDGCRTIGPHDKVLKGDGAPCNFVACKGLESLIRHFASCKSRIPGGCIHCKRMWQLLELHSRLCAQPDVCKVPLCSHFKDKMQSQNKKDETKWRLLVDKMSAAKNSSGTSLNPLGRQDVLLLSGEGR